MNAHSVKLAAKSLDPLRLRETLGHFTTGVTIATTLGDAGAPVGLAANSFASVSLDPPLIVWSLSLQAPSLAAFRAHPAFAINILCDRSKPLALKFGAPAEDKFAGVAWQPGLDGVPVLDCAAAVLQCRTEARMAGGDHEIYLGRVTAMQATDKAPLVFHKGRFASLGDSL